MKSIYIRPGLALLCAATLAACGGGNGNMVLGGRIVGLTQPGLILKNGSWEAKPNAGDATFQFAELIGDDKQFDIVFGQQPNNSKCTIINSKNKANTYTVSQAVVSCITDSYALGGSVTGLDAGDGSLVLTNGKESVAVAAPATAGAAVKFSLPMVMVGAPYGVTVLTKPQGAKNCIVSNGNGIMATAAIDNVTVVCSK
ncbi:hypothetical protein ACFOLJ_11855 [Rugamonas sp. CCM 8940]|uniref:hypothetical protein n=1 Tax=Rugamonas sp. CCM 8940 TaxID=2765359 RepID=UPI0018F74F1E|nr:hypothetical protein [Rugamonas sp. CCM 8940]MBJ7311565.1 hypothetical protein [Rugamonas sp. CCM 8940]